MSGTIETAAADTFEVDLKASAIKELRALPSRDRSIVIQKLELLRNPSIHKDLVTKLNLPGEGESKVFRMRVGLRYRVLFNLEIEHKRITVLAILGEPSRKTPSGAGMLIATRSRHKTRDATGN